MVVQKYYCLRKTTLKVQVANRYELLVPTSKTSRLHAQEEWIYSTYVLAGSPCVPQFACFRLPPANSRCASLLICTVE
jgi:hypothetical protein